MRAALIHQAVVVPKDIASEQAVNRVARPSGRFADFSEIGRYAAVRRENVDLKIKRLRRG